MNRSIKRYRRQSNLKSEARRQREVRERAVRALENTKRRLRIGRAQPGRYEGKALEKAHRVSEGYEDLLKRASRTS